MAELLMLFVEEAAPSFLIGTLWKPVMTDMGIMTKMFEFMSSAEVSYAKVKKCAKKFSVAAQAYMINTELQNFGKEVVASTAKHKRGNRCHAEPNAHIHP